MPREPIDISAWAADEDFPVHPIGSKPKRVLKAPHTGDLPDGILRGHSYLFKYAVGWQRQQVWSEIIAYELSRLAKPLYVPSTFIAVDNRTGETGVVSRKWWKFSDDVLRAG